MREARRSDERTETLTLYLRQIRRTELFTAEQERHAAERARAGDFEARQAMIEHNLRLVVSIAKGYSNRGVPLAELIAEGNLGLIRAIERFDPQRGVRFSTYAVWWIRAALKQAFVRQRCLVRLPTEVWMDVVRVLRVRQALESRTGSQAGRSETEAVRVGELAGAVGLPAARVATLLTLAEPLRSLDAPLDSMEGDLTLGESLADDLAPDPSSAIALRELVEHVAGWLQELSPREREIVEGRYGLRDGRVLSLDELGARLGVRTERVRELHKQALLKIKRHIVSHGMDRHSFG